MPEHLPHCKPVQINWIDTPGPPSAGWRCVAECPVYQEHMASLIADGKTYLESRYGPGPVSR